MSGATSNIPSAKWQTCVSTMQCDFIDEPVSIMVKNDWTSHCTWYREFKDTSSGSQRRVKPDKRIKKKLELCRGPFCSHVEGYRDRLIEEERRAAS